MASKSELELRLASLEGFESPHVEFEQYPTPSDLAAHLIHLADLRGDLTDRTVVDLGTGTGLLAIGVALRQPGRVIGLDRDPAALATAQRNERSLSPPVGIDWLLGDGSRAPVCAQGTTVIMNPPFGAQRARRHADRAFLTTAARIGRVTYSIHNAGSQEFVEAFATDESGQVTDTYQATLTLDRQFPFHTSDQTDLDVEVYRIEWDH